MKSLSINSCRLFAAAAALLIGLPAAMAGWAGVDDKGAFFSPGAKATAQNEIAELQRAQKKDFAIETFPTIPAEAGTVPNPGDKAAVGRFMEQWAEKQARDRKVNGVYALLVKSPAHLQVVVGNDTQRKAFTLRDRDTLVSLMLGNLRGKNYDAALLDGVNFVKATMRSHALGGAATGGFLRTENAPATTHKSSSGLASWIPLIVVGLGAWLVIGLVRALFRGGGSPGAPGMAGAGGSGGGFMSSLFGGLFGAAAGMWMYDQFLGHGLSAFGAENRRDDQPDGYSGHDSDYSGSGGDFGDSSGGSGSSGGSDFGDSGGGGDFGGGGDSGGGGGGDF